MFDESMLKDPPLRMKELFIEEHSPTKPCRYCSGEYIILGSDKCVDCLQKEVSMKRTPQR
jgi:hypothetical protein